MAKKTLSDNASQNEENVGKNEDSTNEDDEPNFSDPEEFVDDITDEELLGDVLSSKPLETDGVESVVVIDGIPIVEPSKLEKLKSYNHKLITRFGKVVDVHYPLNDDGSTKGYIFVEYGDPKHAGEVVIEGKINFDKLHTGKVNWFSDFKKYEEIPEEWEPSTPKPYTAPKDLHHYLLEPDAYDQYCVLAGNNATLTVQIWENSAPEPTLLEERSHWTDSCVQWSPLGTYFATLHQRGAALWGGTKFLQQAKFSHECVNGIDFSPREQYIMTHNTSFPKSGAGHIRLIIWDILATTEKRSFSIEDCPIWPQFRWSHDDKYLACISKDRISIYETPSFGLLDKKSIKVPGIRNFSWSPTDNILAYWVPEDKDVPARVILMDIPGRNEIRTKNLFNVVDCNIFWQKSGDYLCVKVNRFAKRKEKIEQKYTGMSYNFEIFHMREKEIPVDSVEIKEPTHAFAWEPIGNKFAIIHGDNPNTNVSFYEVRCGHQPALLKKLEKRVCNRLYWSPSGQFIVLADLQGTSGTLEFIDTNDFTIMNSTDHYTISDVEWDPTGRYVVTAVSSNKTKVDHGYWIWTFQGRILKRVNLNAFIQLLWRPRPPTLLSSEQIKDIKNNLKKYSSQFENKDRLRLTRASKELIEKRCALMKAFDEQRSKRIDEWKLQRPHRLELRRNIDTDELDSDTNNVEEEEIEFLVKEETFPVNDNK